MNRHGIRAGWVILIVLLTTACSSGPTTERYRMSRLLMGTFVDITVHAPTRDKARRAANAAVAEIERVEDLTSFHRQSGLARVNKSAGSVQPIPVDRELLELISTSIRMAEKTGGAFDPTVGPLSRLWNFSSDEPYLPKKEEVAALLPLVGPQKIEIDIEEGTVRLVKTGMAVDLGAIAKGYALDRSRAVLEEMGIDSALINAGGDILAMGEKEKGVPWKIGVQDPRQRGGILAIVELSDRVIVTSGDYERFFMKDDTRYHHILDPGTGYPSRGVQSASISAKDGVTADALSTAVFVLGPKKGIELIDSLKDSECLIVDAQGKVHMSERGASVFRLER